MCIRDSACSTDGNGRWCELDPREGTKRVVAEAFRNVASVGARPLATTNCLNFGNPERPEIMWQFAESVAGLGEACEALGVPVTGGNVSLYNETRVGDTSQHIWPTPVVGILGLLEHATDAVGLAFRAPDDVVFLIGSDTRPGLAGSALQQHLDLPLGGRLAPVDLQMEANLGEVLHEAAREGLLHSAHDVGHGGLVATLAESALAGGLGVTIQPEEGVDPRQVLFSESPGRVVVTVPSANVRAFAQLCADVDVPLRDIGTVGGDAIDLADVVRLDLEDVRRANSGALAAVLEQG